VFRIAAVVNAAPFVIAFAMARPAFFIVVTVALSGSRQHRKKRQSQHGTHQGTTCHRILQMVFVSPKVRKKRMNVRLVAHHRINLAM
jgi:hypothetical protein